MKLKSCIAALLLISSLAAAPSTAPAESGGTLEVRAAAAFNAQDYRAALPMLRTLENDLRDQPERLGLIREQIRVCVAQLAQTPVTDGGIAPEAEPPVTNEQRKPHPAPVAGEVRALQIKELGNFEYDADTGGNIPKDVSSLSGSTVRIHGFMIPIDQAENITSFALVPSLFACCFGQPPQVQHTIICNAPAGKAVAYYPDELVVEGKLNVEEKKDEGFIVSLFELEVASVKPATK